MLPVLSYLFVGEISEADNDKFNKIRSLVGRHSVKNIGKIPYCKGYIDIASCHENFKGDNP